MRQRRGWRARNADKINADQAKRRQTPEHKEYMRKYRAEWYARNKEKVRVASAAWGRANREKTRAAGARFRAKHPERTKESWQKYQDRHPEERREQVLRHRAKYPARHLLRYTRSRANKLGRQFTLTEEWIETRLKRGCALSGVAFELSHTAGIRRLYGPSIDRIDSSKDYTPGNCRLICVGINLGLQEWGWEPVAKLWRLALELQNKHGGRSLHADD